MKVHFSTNQISFGTLARLCGGELHQGALGDVFVRNICTDSREADDQTAFVALRGERVDGHDYIATALANGCRCVICEHRTEDLEKYQATAIVVNDSELALSKLANAYRQYLHCKTVAVTGSVGKTTTKDLIASVLSTGTKTAKTAGNHNSTVGMPLSMVSLPTDSEWSVLEMGMSGFGEIERLSIAAEPDIAVITNIGSSHMEMLGSRENICRAKLEILSGLKQNGILILSGDEALLENVRGRSYRTLYVSLFCEKADFFAKNIRVETDRTVFDVVYRGGEVKDLAVRILGKHNVYAALYAFAVGVCAGIGEARIREGLWNYLPDGMRQHIYPMGKITVIEDCYNASPESMICAVDVLKEYSLGTGRRSVAVLGDMLELGNDSPALHRSVGVYLAEKGIDRLFTVGKGGNQIAVGARQSGMPKQSIVQNPDVKNLDATAKALLESLCDGDVVLFKASRSVEAERIIAYLRERL
ncbi:MAG: UDP-N-acetylmuramoyl-tripeptide--D-alanyl-D-alanine ligase [Clostridia bacterium]|nr:UDP-N-acetylmuramoyl-tripeptide--D-alanyl-D-alanine ligase [Clostridia bacterium]